MKKLIASTTSQTNCSNYWIGQNAEGNIYDQRNCQDAEERALPLIIYLYIPSRQPKSIAQMKAEQIPAPEGQMQKVTLVKGTVKTMKKEPPLLLFTYVSQVHPSYYLPMYPK